ncbi:SAM-dependent methyltransferase [Luteipulveratus halotolerans]|uniref:SAM-dependent methyltransferase n=1 Tax=Luteipulveratus halotolerans TaxID=1631356 RepID=A0A0L6CE70_9MICO|nr:SAM-dependent methyltransferase [Luteipulveratus halotolerans]KNX36171.1 hypothetical protein VV01_01825 [Luteipulveratus halotolerans]
MSREPWESAWQRALYGPGGFYRQPVGPAGHFATSAQGIPGVGRVLARAVVALAEQYDVAHVVEVGAGRGELLRQVHALVPDLHLTGLDVVDRPEGVPAAIDWQVSPGGSALPDELGPLTDVLVLAHEWLDVVPLVIGEVDDEGELRVIEVDRAGDESLGDPLDGASRQWCQRYWPSAVEPGDRVEVGTTRDDAWADLCSRVQHGVVVGVDYAHALDDRPMYGTLTGYRDGAQVSPVPDGSCDITAHVAVDSLETDWRTTQRALFGELGLVAPPAQHALSRSDPERYLAGLADRSAGLTATASPGLGDFVWFAREVGVRRSTH